MSTTATPTPQTKEERAEKAAVPVEGEAKKVYDWRLHVLEKAGYGEHASELAAQDHFKVDLHVAVDLLQNGCALETALAILR